MSTRGIYGFHVNGTDKVAYNHADSYPQHLGLNILRELSTVEDWNRTKELVFDLIPIHETRPLDANSEIFQAELRRHYDGPNKIKRPRNFYDLVNPGRPTGIAIRTRSNSVTSPQVSVRIEMRN